MKNKSFYPLIASLMVPMVFTACMEDIYNPEKTREIAPTENTLGISAADGFDWNMMQSVNAVIVVTDDEDYNGTESLIEVFTASPINNPQATPIAAGTAKKGSNLTTVLNLAKAADRIYVRQTDPRGRKEVYEFTVNGTNMVCKLGIQTNAASTRAMGNTRAFGTPLTDPNYEVPTVPTDAIVITAAGASLETGKNYILNGQCTKALSGTGNLYVTENSEIESLPNGNVYIMPGKTLKAKCYEWGTSIYTGYKVQNFGTLIIEEKLIAQLGVEIYNAGTMQLKKLEMQGGNLGSSLINKGNLLTSGDFSANAYCTILNPKKAEINVGGKFYLNSAQLDNYGKVTAFNEETTTWDPSKYSQSIQTNQSTTAIINNFEGGIIDATCINGGAAIYNDGTIKVKQCYSNNSGNQCINKCSMIVTEWFNYRILTLDNGAITGSADGEKPVPKFSVDNNAIVTLQNGSYIYADEFIGGNPSQYKGEGNEISMIRANTTKYEGNTTFNGLVLNLGEETYKVWGANGPEYRPISENQGNPSIYQENCTLIKGTPKYDIDNCAVSEPGNPGGEITEPIVPETSITQLTYAFEDQWPVYGDFDMNDVVLSVNKISADDKTFTIEGKVEAVGASKQIGVGVRLIGAQGKVANAITGTLEDGQSDPTYIITDNAHEFMGAGIQFINTKFGTQSTGGKPFEIKIDFNSAADATAMLDLKKIDFFIYYNTQQAGRQEVHIPGFAPTSKADNSYFNSGDDASGAKGYYLSRENLCWAVCIPSENGVWKWPFEFTPITDTYANFATWITSNATESKDWYKTPVEDTYFK